MEYIKILFLLVTMQKHNEHTCNTLSLVFFNLTLLFSSDLYNTMDIIIFQRIYH